LRDRVQDESVGGFTGALCGSGYAGFQVFINSDGGGRHAVAS
jgi:hypothetical protein